MRCSLPTILVSLLIVQGTALFAKEENNELPPVAPSIKQQLENWPGPAPQFSERSTTRIRVQPQRPSTQTGAANFDRGGTNERSLTQVELNKLAQRDVVLIIDQSSSMLTHDCPGSAGTYAAPGTGKFLLGSGILGIPIGQSVSRWQWCTTQTAELSKQTEQIYKQGITVVMFSSAYEVFQNVTLQKVPDLFRINRPSGGTNLAPALGSQIGAYFKRRAEFRGNVKPLVIGIVTDGCPNNRQAVKQAIIEATHLMRHPLEITVVFFLIGAMDYQGERYVESLESNLTRSGAQFSIVRSIRFDELRSIGLAKALAQSLQ